MVAERDTYVRSCTYTAYLSKGERRPGLSRTWTSTGQENHLSCISGKYEKNLERMRTSAERSRGPYDSFDNPTVAPAILAKVKPTLQTSGYSG